MGIKDNGYVLAMSLSLEVVAVIAIPTYLAAKLDKYLHINLFIFIIPVAALIFVTRRIYMQVKDFKSKN
jgi:hypothetical protein